MMAMRPAQIWISTVLLCACSDNKTVEETRATDAAISARDGSEAEVEEETPLDDDAIGSAEIMIGSDPATVCFPEAGPPHPLALMLQGANVQRKYYRSFCRRVAAYGFVVVVPDHQSAFPNGLFAEASELASARGALDRENGDDTSPLHERVDTTRVAVLGHSYGATTGLSLSEGLRDVPFVGTPKPVEGLSAVVLFAGGGQTMAIQNGKVPVALLNGSLDTKSTPDEARGTYHALAGERALLYEIDGLEHYGMCDVDNPKGAAAETVKPKTSQKVGVRQVSDVTGKLLRAFVFEDAAAWQDVTETMPRKDERFHVTIKQP